MGWPENARTYRALPDGQDLHALGMAAVTLLHAADDRVSWELFAKAVQRSRVLADMAVHPVWAKLARETADDPTGSPRRHPGAEPGPTKPPSE